MDVSPEERASHWERMIAIIIPYKPKASAKMRIRIIPTKIASCCAFALTPASPTIPIASPAAYENQSLSIVYQ